MIPPWSSWPSHRTGDERCENKEAIERATHWIIGMQSEQWRLGLFRCRRTQY